MSHSLSRPRILFMVDDVSLSQVVRLRLLAATLDPARYEVTFACAHFPALIFDGTRFARRTIYSIEGTRVLRAVTRGTALYDERTLRRYVAEEIALFRELQPDLVIGDLRLSLSISGPVCGVPVASFVNAFWHRRAVRPHWPAPDFPILRWFPPEQANRYFERALPFALRRLAAPVNALRRSHGLPAFADLLDVLNFGDHVLYPDVPELVPIAAPAAHEHYLGPVIWSADVPPPRLPQPQVSTRIAGSDILPPASTRAEASGQHPCVYVTLGSSGSLRSVQQLLRVLGQLNVQVLLATAGRFAAVSSEHVLASDYLPGAWAAQRSALVICNGGASTAYQALACGTPVLGLPSNLDQWLAMTHIERAGAGRALRTRGLRDEALRQTIESMLSPSAHRASAQRIASAFASRDPKTSFNQIVAHAVQAQPARVSPACARA